MSQHRLYDPNPTVKGTFHSLYFEFKDRQVRNHLKEPKARESNQKSYAPRYKKTLYLANVRGLKQPFKIDPLILTLIRRKLNLDPRLSIPHDLNSLSLEFLSLF